jgi:NAD(P)H-hydrate epimerase
LESYLCLEEGGLPLILDADAIALAKDFVFHGNAVLTPHPGEFAAYADISKEEILNNPIPALCRCAVEKQAHILLKSHVLYAVSPDGRIGVIDGMNPALAAGGSGDVLAGFCAAIAARQKPFDGYACILAAASLLIRAADGVAASFFDPAELARSASLVAGEAWLPKDAFVRRT